MVAHASVAQLGPWYSGPINSFGTVDGFSSLTLVAGRFAHPDQCRDSGIRGVSKVFILAASRRSGAPHHLTLHLIFLSGFIVPFLVALPLFMGVRAYRRAKRHLETLIG